MKMIAALALAVSLNAHAANSEQSVCANMAAIGKSAAYANASGVSEWDALRAWQNTSSDGVQGRASDAVFEMGVIEIRAVYDANVTQESVGYWTAYSACMGAMK
jgi:hypothetical protein